MEDKEEMANKKKKSSLALPVGILTVILAVIGLVAVIRFTSDFVRSKADNTALKAKYEEMLKPVVMFDPDPFDDLTKADVSQLLYSAVWSLLMDEEGMSKYPYYQGETIGIQVPQADIEEAFIKLYGNEIDISALHSSIDMSQYGITYASALKSYILPITGVDSAYTPKVYSLEKQGTSVILNVGYIGNRAWADISSDEYTAPQPDKYMKITLRERSGGMYVASIQSANGQEIAEALATTVIIKEEASETEEPLTEETTETTTAEPEYETVTDENGEAVTDENGEAQTVQVTGEASEETTGEEESATTEEQTAA